MGEAVCKVLIVDGHPERAARLAALFRYCGHDARTACGPDEALDLARTFWPDAVILETGRPGSTALALSLALRTLLPACRLIPLGIYVGATPSLSVNPPVA
jgi:two-component system OmpR family response regulator